MYSLHSNENLKVFYGKIVDKSVFTHNDTKKVKITLEDFTNENIVVYFADTETSKRATRVENVTVGTKAVISCYADEEKGTATGLVLMSNGKLTFDNKGKDLNVIAGTGIPKGKVKDEYYKITLPLKVRENDEIVTHWIDVLFKDKLAEKAEKIFADGKKPCCVVCGNINEREYNGKTYYSSFGFNFFA